MRYYIHIKFIAIALIISSLSGCSDDFVEREIAYQINSETYFNTESDYNDALIGVYEGLTGYSTGLISAVVASNNSVTGGSGDSDQVGLQEIDNMMHTPENDWLKRFWDFMYSGVNRANYILEFSDEEDAIDFDGKKKVIAETRFLRAFFLFELTKFFGDIPLPKDNKRFALGDEKTIPRSNKEAVYEFIEDDLIYAKDNLEYAASSQLGRATKGAAEALLGKVYLYWEKYDLAAVELQSVIDNGPYQLVDKFSKVFELDILEYDESTGSLSAFSGENNSESVFEIQYTSDANNPSTDNWSLIDSNIFAGFNGPRSYNGPAFVGGYGFSIFTEDFVQKYDENDSRKYATVLDIAQWADAINGLSDIETLKSNFESGIANSLPPVLENDILLYEILEWKIEFPTGTVSFAESWEGVDFYNRKYIGRSSYENLQQTQQFAQPNNYRAIRYADVLLMAAEAYAEDNNEVLALEYLNEVRLRAFGSTSFNITNVSGQALLDAIYLEREFELAGEGHHFFDLVRTERAEGTILNFEANKHLVFPIPREEIIFSEGLWNQNDNY